MSILEKTIKQEHLTKDTLDAQFCSNWLKDEILLLFNNIEAKENRVTELEKTLKNVIEIVDKSLLLDEDLHEAWTDLRNCVIKAWKVLKS